MDNIYIFGKNFNSFTRVFVNGVLQTSGYTVASSNRLSFTTPLPLGKVITIVSDFMNESNQLSDSEIETLQRGSFRPIQFNFIYISPNKLKNVFSYVQFVP